MWKKIEHKRLQNDLDYAIIRANNEMTIITDSLINNYKFEAVLATDIYLRTVVDNYIIFLGHLLDLSVVMQENIDKLSSAIATLDSVILEMESEV